MFKYNDIYLGDCLDIMKSIDDNSVDMILIDPPYGVTAQKWDAIVPFDRLWQNFNRICKKDAVIAIFCAQPFTTYLISSNIKKFKYCWYWNKNQGTNFFHAKRMPIRKVEEIAIFGGKKYYPQYSEGHTPTNSATGCSNGKLYFGNNKRNYTGGSTSRFPDNILNYKCVNNYNRLHPNQKPIELLEYLISTYTKESELVLDCFVGCGSTALAAKNINRNFIGIENDINYFNISKERLK